MKKIVSFFADHSETFDQLNRQAADHARALGSIAGNPSPPSRRTRSSPP